MSVCSPAAALVNRSLLNKRLKHLAILTDGRFAMSPKYRIILAVAALSVTLATFFPLPMQADGGGAPGARGESYFVSAGDSVVPPVAIETPDPRYPDAAKKLGLNGTVQLKALIDENGLVVKIGIIEAFVGFDSEKGTDAETMSEDKRKELAKLFTDEATDALRRWRFEPGTRDGEPVAMEVVVPVKFNLR